MTDCRDCRAALLYVDQRWWSAHTLPMVAAVCRRPDGHWHEFTLDPEGVARKLAMNR